jgi:hypothetical protein
VTSRYWFLPVAGSRPPSWPSGTANGWWRAVASRQSAVLPGAVRETPASGRARASRGAIWAESRVWRGVVAVGFVGGVVQRAGKAGARAVAQQVALRRLGRWSRRRFWRVARSGSGGEGPRASAGTGGAAHIGARAGAGGPSLTRGCTRRRPARSRGAAGEPQPLGSRNGQ